MKTFSFGFLGFGVGALRFVVEVFLSGVEYVSASQVVSSSCVGFSAGTPRSVVEEVVPFACLVLGFGFGFGGGTSLSIREVPVGCLVGSMGALCRVSFDVFSSVDCKSSSFFGVWKQRSTDRVTLSNVCLNERTVSITKTYEYF